MRSALDVRRLGSAVALRQLIIVLTGVAVIVAMVVIAQNARRDEQRHQQVELLAEHVREASDEVGLLMTLGTSERWSGGHPHQIDASGFMREGSTIYARLISTLTALRQVDASAMTLALERDTGRLYADGVQEMPAFTSANARAAAQAVWSHFSPTVTALGRDAAADAALQQRVAEQASSRATRAFVGSLAIGLALLVLLGSQLYRIGRRSLLVEQRRAFERRSEERIRALVENASDIITVVGPDLAVRWQSTTVERTLGHGADTLVGRRLSTLVHPDDAQLLEVQLANATSKPGVVRFTARFRHADGDWRHLEAIAENRLGDPVIEGVLLSMRDVSERKALEDELRHRAFHDALTGLANRALFEDRLIHALAGARRHGNPVGVLFLDLDDFKTINDSLGHSSGDELLRTVALRIATVIRVTDTAARLGGDEFAVLLEMMDDENEPEAIGDRLLEALAPPFKIAGRELRISASIGVATSHGALTADELLRNADTAMYAAKEAGKGRLRVFEPGMHQRVLDRLELTGEMQRALEDEEFELDFQPIVELHEGRIVGAEALVRWGHPDRGRLAPAQFIGLAEETGLIIPLGKWILNAACAQAAAWERDFADRHLYMNVNVSTRQLHDASFPDTVARALVDTGLAPGLLVLEITESLLPEDGEEIIARLHELKALGVQVAVDDFGTGYSALSRLQSYPVDILKIDRSFIEGIEHDAGKGQLVRGIINLGRSLHMDVVAEGIEESEQADQLRQMRSPLGQGYLFSRPVTREQLEALLASREPLATDGLAAGGPPARP
jgi:diguanylate cyclase (GGDEF)-like protein/PAS domain S-box-containing protein